MFCQILPVMEWQVLPSNFPQRRCNFLLRTLRIFLEGLTDDLH